MILALLQAGEPVIVDRIEGELAVVEWPDRAFTEIPLAALPPGVQEGDRLVIAARSAPRRDRGVAGRPALRAGGGR